MGIGREHCAGLLCARRGAARRAPKFVQARMMSSPEMTLRPPAFDAASLHSLVTMATNSVASFCIRALASFEILPLDMPWRAMILATLVSGRTQSSPRASRERVVQAPMAVKAAGTAEAAGPSFSTLGAGSLSSTSSPPACWAGRRRSSAEAGSPVSCGKCGATGVSGNCGCSPVTEGIAAAPAGSQSLGKPKGAPTAARWKVDAFAKADGGAMPS